MSLPTIDAGGSLRILGHRPPKGPRKVAAAPYGSIRPVPEKDWVEFDLRDDSSFTDAVPILDQGSRGACNGHAAASSLEAARWLAGMSPVALSPWYVYAILCRGVDQGSNIGQALTLLTEQGTCRFESVPWGTINPNALSPASRLEALGYKLELGTRALTFADLMTFAQLRIPFNFSVRVGSNFNNLDSEGCPPVSPGPGNHAVYGGFAVKRMKNGKYAIGMQNSWRKAWGLDGYAWIHEGHIARQTWFEAYGVQAAMDATNDPTNPPKVLV